MKKKIEIKNKLINHLMVNGEKKTSEKILIKSLKELQKDSQKQSKKVNTIGYYKLNADI